MCVCLCVCVTVCVYVLFIYGCIWMCMLLTLYRYTLYVTYKPIVVGDYILVLFKSNVYNTYVTLINKINYDN